MSQSLPAGSLVVVTGANGYIGSHVIDEFLRTGYHVRGTVRDVQNNAWVQELFDKKYGTGKLSLVQVKDFTEPGCFDEAAKGADAFAHIASDLTFTTDPNAVVPPMIAGVKNALEACLKEPKIKSFVLTSSSTAATAPSPNKKIHIDKNTWNEACVKAAWADKFDDEMGRMWAVYGASKTQGEQALWEFVKEKKPHFKANSILPNANLGPILDSERQGGSTARWIIRILEGDIEYLAANIPPQYFVHVQDTARLHAAVATDTKYDGLRLFGFAEPFNWNDLLKLVHKIAPEKAKEKNLPEKIETDSRDQTTVDTADALRVLKEKYNQDAWVPLEKAVRDTIESTGLA